ncbi:MAG: hypothetical protein K2I92_08065 [Muribaculaceae bacterium]|nr:hypothetical protein [Muribaculaceae bacterium]
MKRFFYILTAATMMMTVATCSDNDDDMPDDDVIWDVSPAVVYIQLVDEAGDNLLDPAVNGNWVEEPMWIGYRDKTFDVSWKKDDIQLPTKAIMPIFYGAVWTGVWTDNKSHLYFGEFNGTSSQDLKLTFGIDAINTVYEFEYSHRLVWENKEPHFDDHITYNGKQIEGNTLPLVLPKNDQ